jgi:ketosteroid isomerase-like protein
MNTELNDDNLIRQLIEDWAKAVREKNIDAILEHHSKDFVMYDVPEPFQSVGLDAYKKTWNTFFEWAKDFGVFDIKDLHIVCNDDVAFCYASMQCAGSFKDKEKELLNFRLTVGLKKINNQWMILHEHHSIPAVQI